MKTSRLTLLTGALAVATAVTLFTGCKTASEESTAAVTPAEARAIAKEAYTYGYPMLDSYRIEHGYFVDKSDPDYKGTWNEIHNTPHVCTPADQAIQTPNSDTPYSWLFMDLRAEPLVQTMPVIEKMAEAKAKNWTVIGMKEDWATIFPTEKT